MKSVSMSGSLRGNVGKKDAKKQRREEKVPCVLYGGKEQIHFTVDVADFKKIIFTPEVYLIKLNINGNEFDAILQDVQYHPVTDSVLHADFLQVIPGKPVVIGIPLEYEGVAPGVLKGGRLVKKVRKLKVKGLIEEMPDKIKISISKLDIGDSTRVKDVIFGNLEFLDTPNAEIVGVKTARTVVAAADEEESEEGATAEGAGTEGGETPKAERAE
ncbi:MAG: 50S ribosomal protein L25/general stress protein Ctc [Bacteroidales bacterium]